MLLRVGEPYKKVLADETARNLRTLPQLSLVLTLPIRGSTPDRVRLLVITKDVWSLRLGWNIAVGPGGIESLLIQPTETNIAGSHQTVYATFTMDSGAYSLGGGYRNPRLEGHRLTFLADGNVYVNRALGSAEGSFGTVSIQRPLFSADPWAWITGVTWNDQVVRRFIDTTLDTFGPNAIPYQYRQRSIRESAEATRSFGWRQKKNDITFGFEINRNLFHTEGDSSYPSSAVQSFVTQVLPVSDTRVGPYAQWHSYTSDFMRILDFETLGLQEDYRLGHDVWLRVYPVTTALGSSRNFFGTYAAAQYTARISDGLGAPRWSPPPKLSRRASATLRSARTSAS